MASRRYLSGPHSKSLVESRALWVIVIIIVLSIPIYVFFQNRYVGASQEFGPMDTSSLGGTPPFQQVILRLRCGSEDGSYLSDSSDIECQILVKSKNELVHEMGFVVLIMNSSRQTVVQCNGTAIDIDTSSWRTADLATLGGSIYFELPKGDYKVVVKQFSIMGGGVIVTKARPVEFRGELHVIPDFEKKTRLSEDGVSLATFLAFLFLIPTTLIGIRSFILGQEASPEHESKREREEETEKIPQTSSTPTLSNSCKRTRLQSLDDAFLFSIGLTNIVMVFFQIMLGGTDAALLSIPLLVVGLFVPFYIGYLRGTIVVDTVLERIRGWIYFSAGTSIYIAGLAVIFLRDYGDLSLILYLLFYGTGFVLSRSWIRSILRATGAHLSKKDLVVIGATVGATIALLYAVLIGEEHIRFMASSQSWRPENVIIRIGGVAFALLVFIIIERTVRRLALSTHEITLSYDVNSVSGASVQVMMSSSLCLLKGAMSDKKALLSAGMSFLIYSALVTVAAFPNLFPMPNTVTVVVIGVTWLVLYVFAVYRYLKAEMKVPTTDEIFKRLARAMST